MKRLFRFLIERWYGACVAWLALGALTLAIEYVFGPYSRFEDFVSSCIWAHASVGVIMLAAVVGSLVKRRWRRAIGQLLLTVVSAIGYVVAFVVITVMVSFSDRSMKGFDREQQPWYGTGRCAEMPFSVEYRVSHPFLAEYDRRIVFESGKAISLNCDTGGAGDFAVYVLNDGSFYLLDCFNFIQHRSEYRVDVKAETVERKGSDVWLRIPDGALEVKSWSDSSLSVKTPEGERTSETGTPIADTLNGSRYLGRITTRGRFVKGGTEPAIEQDKVVWTASKMSDDIPFAYERGESKTHRTLSQISFRSGKRIPIVNDWRHGSHDVYRMKDGRFVMAAQEGTMWESAYVIDASSETVCRENKGYLVRIPEEAREICGVISGKGLAALEIRTGNGKVRVSGTERIETLYRGSEYLGRIEPDGSVSKPKDETFDASLKKALLVGSSWNDEVELKKMAQLFGGLLTGDRKAIKERFKAMPGWEISYAGESGDEACRVYRSDGHSCCVSLGLDGNKVQWKVSAAGRSDNPKAARYAAALAAIEELESLKR